MLSAGNDIVSLSDINVPRTITKQFYSKILSDSEIAFFESSKTSPVTFENYVWLLWSIKESAYKFLKRTDPDLLFTPVKFEVKQLDIPDGYLIANFKGPAIADQPLEIKATVEFDSEKLYSRSAIYNQLIFSVVDNNADFDAVFWAIKAINSTNNKTQSSEVRAFLIDRLEQLTGKENLGIHKNLQGVPLLFDGSTQLPIAVSLTHHGHFVAYSFKTSSPL